MREREALSNRPSVNGMTLIALMTAIICVLGPISIPMPFSPIPVSFTNFIIYLTVYVLGMKKAAVSFFLYMLIGIIGLPVFSGFSSGIGKLAGPTGGYLVGFIFLTLIAGFFVERFPKKKLMAVIGMTIGLVVCYMFGSLWLSMQAKITFAQALLIGVVPYIIADIIKIAVAVIVGPKLRKVTVQLVE